MFRTFTWLLPWIVLQHTCVVFSQHRRHVWIQKHTCVCPQQQLVGQPLTLGCNPQLISSATHIYVCSQRQSVCQSCWMFRTFIWLLHWNILQDTYVCVCSQQQLVGQPSVDLFCSTRSAEVFTMIKASIDLFCSRHVRIQKHRCACPQQQLVGQPATLG